MKNNTFLINCTNPLDYSNSLQEIGNKKHSLWNGFELALDSPRVKANSQIFIKNDLHFYRTDYLVDYTIVLKVKQEEIDQDYIDFRIDRYGKSHSMIEDKELRLQAAPKKDQSFHIYIKKKVLGINNDVLEIKRKKAYENPILQKISSDILTIPATGNKNALLVERKMLELSYAYLEFLHAPVVEAPSFLSCDYKLQCIKDAKQTVENSFTNPPTIKELSKKVGINSNQLKIGFKHLFGTTIRQYVIKLRLEHAQQMILSQTAIAEL